MADIRTDALSLLAGIDKLVVAADEDPDRDGNAEIVALANKLLPNTTGLGRQGWSTELEEFFSSPPLRTGRSRYTFSTAEKARDNLRQPRTPPRFWDDDVTNEPHPALARATYALLALNLLESLRGRDIGVAALMEALPPLLEPWPVEPTVPRTGPRDAQANARYLLDGTDRITDADSWRVLAGEAVSPAFAEASTACFGTLEDAGGQYCSTVYTEHCADDVSVAQVREILHPLNWDLCYPAFFHSMAQQKPYYTPPGWYRIVEEISAEPTAYTLKTALIFSLEDRDNGYYINYQLDPNRQGEGKSIGIVEIDNGYIWVTPKNQDGTGVRIRTSKEERVSGLSPTATAALACHLGWGDSAYEMIVMAARKASKGSVKLPNGRKFENWPSKALAKQPVDTGPPLTFETVPATLPINAVNALQEGACLVKSLINRVSANAGDAASRWLDGTERHDVEHVTTQMGEDLKEWSLEVYETAERNVKPPKEKP